MSALASSHPIVVCIGDRKTKNEREGRACNHDNDNIILAGESVCMNNYPLSVACIESVGPSCVGVCSRGSGPPRIALRYATMRSSIFSLIHIICHSCLMK